MDVDGRDQGMTEQVKWLEPMRCLQCNAWTGLGYKHLPTCPVQAEKVI